MSCPPGRDGGGLSGGAFASGAATSERVTMDCSGAASVRAGPGLGAWPGGAGCAGRCRVPAGSPSGWKGGEGGMVRMRRYMLVAAVTAAAALTGLAPAGGAPAGAAARGVRAAPGARLWVARYDDRSGGYEAAHAMAVSPDGSRVFVTGEGYGGGATGRDYATVAYSANTGRQLWVRRYAGSTRHGIDIASSVAVSPGGTTVFVTGFSHGRGTGDDYATVAYSAATGRRLWVRRYNGPGNGYDQASSVAVSPAGTTVFVTGWSEGRRTGGDYATVAYRAATGNQLWVRRY